MIHRVYLGLGSNLGDKEGNIRRAVALIGERVGPVLRQSSLIETEPWGFESENKFLNGVILVETELSPRELLKTTQRIERALGRKKKSTYRSPEYSPDSCLPSPDSCLPSPDSCLPSPVSCLPSPVSCLPSPDSLKNYSDRPIDIDILLYDDLTVDEPDLKIPHPLMEQRDFVMIPLREIF